MIKATNISKSFGKINVLKEVSLTIENGEIVTIVGASGAGKTTLLHILGTLDKADKGTVEINNMNVLNLNNKNLASFRNKNIGFVFQFHHLLPEFSSIENVCIPAFIGGQSKKETERKAIDILKFLGLTERIHHKPNELSGGEQQRVAVARALINNPSVIFADEPSGNLDSKTAKDLHQLFFTLREKYNQTFVIVTHNKELANMADRKLIMQDGNIL